MEIGGMPGWMRDDDGLRGREELMSMESDKRMRNVASANE